MLQDSSKHAEHKVHWTQTPEGRKKMSKQVRKQYKSGKRKPRAKKGEGKTFSMDVYVLAKRLQREVRKRLHDTGELEDITVAAHLLVQSILK